MRGLEGDGEGDQPLEGKGASKRGRKTAQKDGYDSHRAAGDERAESDGVFKAATKIEFL